MIRDLFSSTLDVLHKTLDLRQQRHTVLASNIANAETPGFIAKDVRFEEALQAGATPPQPSPLRQTHPEHCPSCSRRASATYRALWSWHPLMISGAISTPYP